MTQTVNNAMSDTITKRKLSAFEQICILSEFSPAANKLYTALKLHFDNTIVVANYNAELPVKNEDLILIEYDANETEHLLSICNYIEVKAPASNACLFGVDQDNDVSMFLERFIIKGIFKNDMDNELIIKGICKVNSGAYWFSRQELDIIAGMRRGSKMKQLVENYKLTTREHEILYYLSEGLTTQEIAKNCGIAINTIKTHKNNLYKKLNITSSEEAIFLATSYRNAS